MKRTATALCFSFLLCAIFVSQAPIVEAQERSPKPGWQEFPEDIPEDSQRDWWQHALMWFPNRLLDFVDIFRVDAGVGPAAGAVLRVTPAGQVGYRNMMPFSARMGLFGRKAPVMVESSNEIGVGPAFIQSKDRAVCTGEVGVGADLFLVGGYGGVCFDEVADFALGLFFIDFKNDDY